MDGLSRVDASPEVAWLASAVGAVVLLMAGALAFPRLVWDRFLWHYFWGPVFADAHNAPCAVLRPTGPTLLDSVSACRQAVTAGAIVAEPGYTLVSEAGYVVTLVFLLIGVFYLVRNLDVGTDRHLFFALVPFILFGGALRVVEDANDAASAAGIDPVIAWPASALIISPLIYGTVFVVVLAALLGTVALDRRDHLDGYAGPMAVIGGIVFTGTVAYLLGLALTTTYLGFHPLFPLATLAGATLLAGGLWLGLDRWAPWVHRGTGLIGLAVIWGHAVDGMANYLAADWTDELGVPVTYGAKHPVNRILNDLVGQVAPSAVTEALGVAWGFLTVKLVASVAIVALFDEEIFVENPRYALLLLVAVLAVGLGPGTRDMLRATFGI